MKLVFMHYYLYICELVSREYCDNSLTVFLYLFFSSFTMTIAMLITSYFLR